LPQRDTIQLYVRPPIPKFILHPVIDDYGSLFDPAVYGTETADPALRHGRGWGHRRVEHSPARPASRTP